MIARLLAAAVFCAAITVAQPAFEVASIKPSAPDQPGSRMSGDQGRLVLENYSLKHCIQDAYGVQGYQISGGPKWLDGDHYDIEGKLSVGTPPNQRLAMLQRLLADRFQLQFHRETRTVPGYAVVIAKGGPKLPKPENPDAPSNWGSGSNMANGRNLTMAGFAQTLSRSLGRPVVDETGYQDKFDFRLRWSADAAPPSGDAEPGPSVFAAIQEQLGLKLEARRVPVEVLVIERAEKPTEN
jgi:uncharacterized protein (TIGR03435 family)